MKRVTIAIIITCSVLFLLGCSFFNKEALITVVLQKESNSRNIMTRSISELDSNSIDLGIGLSMSIPVLYASNFNRVGVDKDGVQLTRNIDLSLDNGAFKPGGCIDYHFSDITPLYVITKIEGVYNEISIILDNAAPPYYIYNNEYYGTPGGITADTNKTVSNLASTLKQLNYICFLPKEYFGEFSFLLKCQTIGIPNPNKYYSNNESEDYKNWILAGTDPGFISFIENAENSWLGSIGISSKDDCDKYLFSYFYKMVANIPGAIWLTSASPYGSDFWSDSIMFASISEIIIDGVNNNSIFINWDSSSSIYVLDDSTTPKNISENSIPPLVFKTIIQ